MIILKTCANVWIETQPGEDSSHQISQNNNQLIGNKLCLLHNFPASLSFLILCLLIGWEQVTWREYWLLIGWFLMCPKWPGDDYLIFTLTVLIVLHCQWTATIQHVLSVNEIFKHCSTLPATVGVGVVLKHPLFAFLPFVSFVLTFFVNSFDFDSFIFILAEGRISWVLYEPLLMF